jgi:predicted DNA binding CopG/RHH family protein
MADEKKRKPVPKFSSDEEEVKHWLAHDSSEYELGETVEVEVSPRARTQAISIRLPKDLLERLKGEAGERGVPYQRLIRERLEGKREYAPHWSAAERHVPYDARTDELRRSRERLSRGGAGSSRAA